jgi:hypothetical protein
MGNDSDREYLKSLPELEREKILSDRAEKVKSCVWQHTLFKSNNFLIYFSVASTATRAKGIAKKAERIVSHEWR